MPFRPLPALLSCCALLSLGSAACGDDDTASSYVDAANGICDSSFENIQLALSRIDEASAEAVTAFLDDVYVLELRSRLEALRGLDIPSGDRSELEEVLSDYEAVIDRIAADPGSYAALAEDPFAEVDARLDRLRLVACGSRQPSEG